MVTYPNKEPAKSVPVKISATGIKQNEKQDLKPNGKTSSEDETNAMGEAEFVVDSCADCPTIQIKVWSTFITSLLCFLTFVRFGAVHGELFRKGLHSRSVRFLVLMQILQHWS